jgi:hypothetical protein
MEATMLRGYLSVLVLLGAGGGLAFSQSAAPPSAFPQNPSPGFGPALGGLPTGLGTAPGTPSGSPGPAPGTPGGSPGAADKGGDAEKPAAPGTTEPKAPGQTGQTGQSQGAAQNGQKDPNAELKRDHYGPCARGWTRGGFLLWWLESAPAPGPLVTTGTPASGGLLGNPDTRILSGTNNFNYSPAPGIWLEGGVWVDDCHQWAVGLAGFVLEHQTQGTFFSSDPTGSPLLARPFIDATKRPPDSLANTLIVSAPGVATGNVGVSSDLRFFGGEANVIRNLVYTPTWELQVLAGFRYLDLMENLNIASNSTLLTSAIGVLPSPSPVPTVLPPGTRISVADRFTTRNQLYLGQVGGQVTWRGGPFFVNLEGKVGLGPNGERVRILGSTVQDVPGVGTFVSRGGLLALPGTPALPGGNLGVHSSNFFVIVPEVGLDVGWKVSERVSLAVGYSFLYIGSVARPGSQVNSTVNPALVPSSPFFGSPSGPGQPVPLTKQDEFWAHGLRFTVEFRF